ncbi:MAG: hypothetical protein MJ252_02575, partial [archaeon]|nr:hypothetical protein [archaeon]
MKKKSFSFIFLFLQYNLILTKNFIKIPFKRKESIDSDMTQKEICETLERNTLLTEINIGTPYQ